MHHPHPRLFVPTALLLAACGGGSSGEPSWKEQRQMGNGDVFSAETVAELPPPARRFLLHAIAPGTPLARSVELSMHGTIRPRPDRDPTPMTAEQILTPPEGFLWRARVKSGVMPIRGFDRYRAGAGEMRWRLWGIIPVMRATGEDITRSAAGRLAMEAILLPAALVPGRGATWEAVDDSTARFRLTVGPETVTTTVVVDPDGRLLRASAPRWREARDGTPAGYDRFDVQLEGEFRSGGYTIPRRVRAGWRVGEPDEFRFFDATLDRATFR